MAAAVLQKFMPFMNQTRNASATTLSISAAQQTQPAAPDGLSAEDDQSMQDPADASGDEDASEHPSSGSDTDSRASDSKPSGRVRHSKRKAIQRRGASPEERVPDESDDSLASGSTGSSDNDDGEPDEWEAESDADAEAAADGTDTNACLYCGETEENDPSDEYEQYLTCQECGDNAHRQCARDQELLGLNEDADEWRCGACIGHEHSEDQADMMRKRKSATPKIARDLLPADGGIIKPGSHSVFNTLILDDDPMDGSRSLRKRRSSMELDERPEPPRKRERRRTNEPGRLETTLVDGSPVNNAAVEEPGSSRPRSARSRAQRRTGGYLAMVIQSTEDSLIMSFKIDHDKLANERRKQKRRDRERSRRSQAAQLVAEDETFHYPALQTSSFTHFYAFNEKEGDEVKARPYGGILTEQEADTTKTFPQVSDRKRFEDVRLKAEEDWRERLRSAAASEQARPAQKQAGPPSKIKCVNFGAHEIDTWHAAPYPEEYSRNKVLYICEFCLKYMNSDYVAWRHKLKCPAKHPPGDEIYRDGQFSFFEVDGRKNPVYCQNLCLLAKLFLGSKTLYYDVEPFLFYVMTENDEFGYHFVGYFSKEKRPSSQNNVSCILVLPIHQRRGFGHMLIDFSYMLTKVEQKTGSPEKPLSDMGLVSYRSYWRLVLCNELLNQTSALSITDISERTGMTADDIVCALEGLRALVRDPVTKTYAFRLDFDYFRQYIEAHERKGYTKLNKESLMWVPYVMGRDNMHYEHAPPLHTVAQRDEDGDAELYTAPDLLPNGDMEKEFAKSFEENLEGHAGSRAQDDDLTPFPSISSEPQSQPLGGMRRSSHSKSTSASGTLANNSDHDGDFSSIPPARFEIFPPLPFARKRGRPPGSRTRNHSFNHPRSRPESAGVGSPSAIRGPSSLRRSRTALDNQVDGTDEDVAPGKSSKDFLALDSAHQARSESGQGHADSVGDSDADNDLEAETGANDEIEEGAAHQAAELLGEEADAEGSPDPETGG